MHLVCYCMYDFKSKICEGAYAFGVLQYDSKNKLHGGMLLRDPKHIR